MDDEIIGLRSRLDRLQRSLRFIDEPVATALIKGVIADMEARIAAVENDRQQQAGWTMINLKGGQRLDIISFSLIKTTFRSPKKVGNTIFRDFGGNGANVNM